MASRLCLLLPCLAQCLNHFTTIGIFLILHQLQAKKSALFLVTVHVTLWLSCQKKQKKKYSYDHVELGALVQCSTPSVPTLNHDSLASRICQHSVALLSRWQNSNSNTTLMCTHRSYGRPLVGLRIIDFNSAQV